MKIYNLQYIICPDCGSGNLTTESFSGDEREIIDGKVTCSDCEQWYRIEKGILELLPTILINKDLRSKFLRKYKLSDCTSIDGTQNKIIHPQKSFFKEKYDHYEKRVVENRFYRALESASLGDWVSHKINKGDTLLNLGCGTGRENLFFAERGIKSIGLDISEEMLILARAKIENLGFTSLTDFVVADAEDPPFKDNIFKACIFYAALHHFNDKKKAIINAARKLVPGGHFFSMDPHKSPVRFIFDLMMKLWRLYEDEQGTDLLISGKDLKEWLTEAGIDGDIIFSTYLPPHLFYYAPLNLNYKMLKLTNSIFGKLYAAKKLGGVVMAVGSKKDITL